MSTPVPIGIIVGVLAIGGLLGAVLLFALASGDSGPRRFGVTMPDSDFLRQDGVIRGHCGNQRARSCAVG
ncbi:hypothetical protein HNP40_001511 [Mycobacteroides chelonae]|nr:hypothetical protein [Mycobacteroides chelonae]